MADPDPDPRAVIAELRLALDKWNECRIGDEAFLLIMRDALPALLDGMEALIAARKVMEDEFARHATCVCESCVAYRLASAAIARLAKKETDHD